MKRSWLTYQRLGFLAAVCLLLVLSGCASRTKYGAANIDSVPAGAEVINLKDSSHLGSTPVKVSFPGDANTSEFITVQLRKPGYIDRITSFWINKRHTTQSEAKANAVDIRLELEPKN